MTTPRKIIWGGGGVLVVAAIAASVSLATGGPQADALNSRTA